MSSSVKNIDQILSEQVMKFPDKTALTDGKRFWSYKELEREVSQFAGGLKYLGINPGDCVAVMLPRIPEVVISFLSILRIEAIFAPVDPQLGTKQLKHVFDLIQPKLLITDSIILKDHSFDSYEFKIVVSRSNENKYLTWERCLKDSIQPNAELKPETICYYNMTSGSTGKVKVVSTSHVELYWNTHSSNALFGYNDSLMWCCLFPGSLHSHEHVYRPIFCGGTSVCLETVFPRSVKKHIEELGITHLKVHPYFLNKFLECLTEGGKWISTLKVIEASGVVNEKLRRSCLEKIDAEIYSVWGSTETTGIAVACSITGEYSDNVLGEPMAGYEYQVWNEDNEEVQPGETGEMVLRGEAVAKSYLRNEKASEGSFTDGWYHTGDLVKNDQSNKMVFEGRKSGKVEIAGMTVIPEEIEQVILKYEGVESAAVVAVPDNVREYTLMAYVKANDTISMEILKKFMFDHLPSYMVPKKIIKCKSLPLTSMGKIDKMKIISDLESSPVRS